MNRRRILRWSASLVFLLAIVLVPFALFGAEMEALALRLMDSATGRATIALAGIGLLAGDILLPVPSSVVATLLGTGLGAVAGTLAGAFGLTLGSVGGYALARLAQGAARELLGEEDRARAAAAFARWGVLALAVCRPVPVLAEASVLAAGALGVPFRRFLAVTGLANVGLCAVYATLGALAQGWISFVVVFAASLALPGIAIALSGGAGQLRLRRRAAATGGSQCEK